MTEPVITLADVQAAAGRLSGVAHHTPVLTSRTLDERTGASIFLKCENFQRIGAFKFRGAYNAIVQLPDEDRMPGVATYSSGNHAQAVALSARLLGTTAMILMPEDTPAPKLDATREYGAEVVTYDRYTGDRTAIGAALAAERGLTLIPPYEHPHVMAGQGTAALELIGDTGPLDVLVVPIGGGGLMAGCATASSALSPGVQIIGVEPKAGDDTKRSLDAGHRVTIPVPRTIADGQAAETPGEMTFSVIQRLVDEIVLVSDDEIRDAMAFLFDRMKLVTEPSGAIAVAALLTGKIKAAGKRIGVIVSGGNIGVNRFCELLGGHER